MNWILFFIAGFIIGGLFGIVISRILHPCIGRLIIDHKDPEKDVYRMDMVDFGAARKKVVVLKIEHINNDPRK